MTALALLTLLIAAACTASPNASPSTTPTPAPNSGVEDRVTQRLSVGVAPSVVAETFAGNIDVVTGNAGEVSAEVIKVAYLGSADAVRAELAKIAVQVSQDEGIVKVSATPTATLDPRTTANLRIVVPAATALDLTDTFGKLTIDASGALLNARFTNGALVFRGTLAPGRHTVHATSGSVSLTLPTGSSFGIDASATLGSVTSEFALTTTERATTNALKGVVGGGSTVDLVLSVGSGSIQLLQGAASAQPSPADELTPTQAADLLRKTVTGARPLLIINGIPEDWRAVVSVTANTFRVTYRSANTAKSITLSLALTNPPLPGPSAAQTYPRFHGDAASLYQVADATTSSDRFLIWTEPGTWSQPGSSGVPYLLSATGMTDAEFWQLAESLHPNQI